jgi:hypothetical protein
MLTVVEERRNAAILKALAEQVRRHKANQQKAREFLMRLGCWNEDGSLKEEWGGNHGKD